MKRTKLSNPLIVTKLVLLLVFVLLVRMIEVFDNKQLLILAIIFGFILYSTFNLPDKIEFDDDYMYVIRKDGIREVRLENVFYIAKIRLSVNNNLYKLRYYYKGTEYKAKFYPSYFSKSLVKFKKAVINKNPKAAVDSFSTF